MTLKLVMRHWLHEYCEVYSNDDPGLTLTFMYFTSRLKLVPFVFVWENASPVDYQETVDACGVESWYILSNI